MIINGGERWVPEADLTEAQIQVADFEAALVEWYDGSNGSTKQSMWPTNLWEMAREVVQRQRGSQSSGEAAHD